MKLLPTVTAGLAATIASNAATTLSYDPANSNTGNYYGQSFTANDAGFSETGDPLGATYALQTVEIAKWSTTGYTIAQEAVYLNIYDGNTFLGSSTNTVDWTTNVDGIIGDDVGDAYTFAGVAGVENLSSSTQYNMYFSTTNVAGDFIVVRPGVTNASSLGGANLLNENGSVLDAAYDARFVITTAAVPEPSSAYCIGLAALTFIMRRRK